MSLEHMPTEPRQTLSEEQERILRQVRATFTFMGSGDTDDSMALRPWLQWQNREMFKHITLDHYTLSELMCLTAVSGPVFSRLLVVNRGPEIFGDGRFRGGLHLV